MPSVIVIGGGVSGLATARYLMESVPNLDLKLLEASDASGGNIRTDRSDGFVTELGPNGFLNQHPSTLDLANGLGLADEVISGCEQMRRRYIFWQGKLRRFPDSPSTFFSTDLLSVSARARMLLEPLIAAGPGVLDETVGQFARRRLGREASELLIDPVVSGIYAGDPDRLSLRSALPHLAQLDGKGKSVLLAMVQNRHSGAPERSASPSVLGRRRYISFREGLQQFTDALAHSLGSRLRTKSPVAKVEKSGGRWRVVVNGPSPRDYHADVVVSAAPSTACRRFLRDLHPDISGICAKTPYAPVAVVALGYREADIPHPLRGFGHLVPSRSHTSVLGGLWTTSIFPSHRAAPGRVLIQCVLGGARDPEICTTDQDILIHRACVHLRKALGVTVPPIYVKVQRHHLGIPQYEVGHADRLKRLDAALNGFSGLFMVGNAFRGVGINTCTADAERVAQRVGDYLSALGERPPTIAQEHKSNPLISERLRL